MRHLTSAIRTFSTLVVLAAVVGAATFLVTPAVGASPQRRAQTDETTTTSADATASTTTTQFVDDGAPAAPNEGAASPKTWPAILLFGSALIVLAACARLYRVRARYSRSDEL